MGLSMSGPVGASIAWLSRRMMRFWRGAPSARSAASLATALAGSYLTAAWTQLLIRAVVRCTLWPYRPMAGLLWAVLSSAWPDKDVLGLAASTPMAPLTQRLTPARAQILMAALRRLRCRPMAGF